MPPRHDVIDAGARPARPRRSRTAVAAVSGLAVGAVLGSVLTASLRTGDPAPVRALAELGAARESLGEVVVPVEVVNTGGDPFVVQGLRGGGSTGAGVTFALVDGEVRVPPGEVREPLFGVRRDCPTSGQLPLGVVRLEVVLRAGDDTSTQAVRVPEASSRLLGLLSCGRP